MIAIPDVEALPLGFGNPAAPRSAVQLLEHVAGKIAFVRNEIDRIVRTWRCFAHLLQVVLSDLERLAQSRRITLISFVNLGGDHRAAVQIHRMLRLVGQVRPPILHLGDLGLGIDRRTPILVREGLVLAPAVQPNEIFRRGGLDAAFLGHAQKHLAVALAGVTAHDGAQRRIGLHGRSVDADTPPQNQTRLGQHLENPGKDCFVDSQRQPGTRAAQRGMVWDRLVWRQLQELPQ